MSSQSETPKADIILRCSNGTRKRRTIDVKASDKLIKCSQVLQDVLEYSTPDGPVTLPIDASALQSIVQYIDTCPTKRDKLFEAKFFNAMSDEALFTFSKAADYLDIEQLRVAIGDYIINKLSNMTATQIGEYLGVRDDYTEEERLEMVTNPSMFYMKQQRR